MSLSIATLSSIQRAGAAIFAADLALKNAVQDYAQRVNAAMVGNPYGSGNNTLFENWKVAVRLSQSMVVIEDELSKLYQIAAALNDQPLAVEVSAPAKSMRPIQRQPRASTAARSLTKRADSPTRKLELGGNAGKLLRHLEKLLDPVEFKVISQTEISREIGIPLGSMTAATKKLIESGRLMAGPAGGLKLVSAR